MAGIVNRTTLPLSFVPSLLWGYCKSGTIEVAVKKLRREEFEMNPPAMEYLEREIKIMKLLRSCEYVVHLHHDEVRSATLFVMLL